MSKKINQIELRQKLKEEAMPEVKRLVNKFGRQIISGCLLKLADYEKKMRELEMAKENVKKLEKEID